MAELVKGTLEIVVRKFLIRLDPDIEVYVYEVEVHRDGGVWQETCPTRELLNMFLRGVSAGCENHVSLPEIPEVAELLDVRPKS